MTDNVPGLEGTRGILFLILSVEKVHVMPCLKPLHEMSSVRAQKIGQALEDAHYTLVSVFPSNSPRSLIAVVDPRF